MLQQLALLLATIVMSVLSTVAPVTLRQVTHCTKTDDGKIGNPNNHHPQNWESLAWVWPDGDMLTLTRDRDDFYAVRNFVKTRGNHTEGELPPKDVELVGVMLADVRGDDSNEWDVTLKVLSRDGYYWTYRAETGCMIHGIYLGLCWRMPDPDAGYWDMPERFSFDRDAENTGFCYEFIK